MGERGEMFLIKLFIKALILRRVQEPLMRSVASGSEYFIFIRHLDWLTVVVVVMLLSCKIIESKDFWRAFYRKAAAAPN